MPRNWHQAFPRCATLSTLLHNPQITRVVSQLAAKLQRPACQVSDASETVMHMPISPCRTESRVFESGGRVEA